MCGQEYSPTSGGQKFCAKCRHEADRIRRRQWYIDNQERELRLAREWDVAHPGNAAARTRKWHHTLAGLVYGRRAARKAQAERRTRCFLDMNAFDAKCEKLGWHCQICGRGLTRDTATVDHIIPCKLGGTNEIDNLQPLCMKCNNKKGIKPMRKMLGPEFLFV